MHSLQRKDLFNCHLHGDGIPRDALLANWIREMTINWLGLSSRVYTMALRCLSRCRHSKASWIIEVSGATIKSSGKGVTFLYYEVSLPCNL